MADAGLVYLYAFSQELSNVFEYVIIDIVCLNKLEIYCHRKNIMQIVAQASSNQKFM